MSGEVVGLINKKRAMVLGAGEMAELALECLVDQGVRTSIVANRTFERATELAERYGGVAMHYDDCWAALAQVFFFTSTRRHTSSLRDWSSDVCSSDLPCSTTVRSASTRSGSAGSSGAVGRHSPSGSRRCGRSSSTGGAGFRPSCSTRPTASYDG